ncbi:MAG: LPS export ABC transporter periplasmic protein LptC [Alphaproteobacteria bacterium]|nr:LPS export ABC transporter periplasmic protein LptC [Alphaproteobacteria bacterium]
MATPPIKTPPQRPEAIKAGSELGGRKRRRGRKNASTPLGTIPIREGIPAATQRAHRRNVFVLRLALPAVAVLIVSVVAVWSQWSNIETRFRIGLAQINPEEAKTLRMVKPRFAGTNKRSRPFTLTADEARRARPGADEIVLKNPKGDMTTDGGAWVALMAARGNYAQKEQVLDLGGGVDLYHDKGLHFASPTARIDLKAGTAEGKDPVTGSGPSIDVTGEGFKVLDGGKTVVFTGKSKAILYPKDKRTRKAPPARTEQ